MKKNGFTLVEVITVIVILGIIILIAVPSYIGISENLKQKEYDNKLKQIEIKATEWATDNNITEDQTITISRLVDDGYVNMDDETSDDKRVINPINKESMECYHVEITVDNGSYKAKIIESEDCELKDIEEQDKNIKVVAYEIDSSTNKILSNQELELQGNELPWSGKDILLLTTSDIYTNPKSITYSSGSSNETKSGLMYSGTFQEGDTINVSNYQNLYVVSANVILKSKYNISYEMETEKPRKQILVKIDKENPNGSYRMLEKWGTSGDKKVLLSGSDGVGSGVKGFYINTENTLENAEYIEANEKSEATIQRAMGTYYYWVEDRVGNKNIEANILNITNIDDTPPECVYRGENTGEWTNQPVTISWGCKDNESGCATDFQSHTINNGVISSFDIPKYTITDVAGNKTECGGITVSVKFDNEPPSCSTSKSHQDTPDGVTISVSCDNKGRGAALSVCDSGGSGLKTGTYTYRVSDKAGNSASCSATVTGYQMYWRQDANSCRHTNFGCDQWPSCRNTAFGCDVWNTECAEWNRSCSTGCSRGVLIDAGSPYASCWEGCRSCSDSGCVASVPDYFQGGCARHVGTPGTSCWNTSCKRYRNTTCNTATYGTGSVCGACQLGSNGTGGAECGWHDVGWNRSSCSGNLCHVTNEQTWYT